MMNSLVRLKIREIVKTMRNIMDMLPLLEMIYFKSVNKYSFFITIFFVQFDIFKSCLLNSNF